MIFNEFKRENLALVSMTLPSCLFNHVPHLMLQHTVYTLLPIQTADTSLSVCCTTCHEVNLKISFHSLFLSLLFLFKGVSGIVGRAEILACTFFSLSFLSYHKYVQNFFLSMNIFFLLSRFMCTWGRMASNKNNSKLYSYITREEENAGTLWKSIVFGGLAMLSKESGLTVFIVNLLYDFYRNWSTIKKTVHDVRWNHESYRFAKRMFCVLVSFIVLSMARIALLQGSLPRFSQQDNPAAFHSSFQVRFLTFLYLSSFNSWLLLCPSQLSHDWQMGSIPLIMSFRDTRNILTLFTFCVILLIIYKIYNDLEVSDNHDFGDLMTTRCENFPHKNN